jgi:superfamily II DNA or RNA helicase
MFITERSLQNGTWQSFERAICRLIVCEGFEGTRLVGRTGDKGADIISYKNGKRWLFQAKHWKNRVGVDVIDQTIAAMQLYRAHIPAIVSLSGFDDEAREHQRTLLSRGIPLQLITADDLVRRATHLISNDNSPFPLKDYQEEAVQTLIRVYRESYESRGLVVMATGLGKTVVAAETLRRINNLNPIKVLILAHTNELVYQLERAFWRFLKPNQTTLIWNGYEQPQEDEMKMSHYVFGCLNTVSNFISTGGTLDNFNFVLVDECHHVGGNMYSNILEHTAAGKKGGPFLMGLTATPWRPDEKDLEDIFGPPLVCVDMVTGLRRGFLSNVDYRMYTDNINWDALASIHGEHLSPRQINRTLFITQWDDSVAYELQKTWKEQPNSRAIVFCGTIDHAITMRDRINALGFCNAAAIYSQTSSGFTMNSYERNKTLCDFHDGVVNVICAVDIFNEGVDVPDVNIIVFQRVTHSRRIFIQQLGRGLRLAQGKDKVIVLDFVSDIRRFAAGISLKDNLLSGSEESQRSVRIHLPHKVSFVRVGAEDPQTEGFLRQWLDDVSAIEDAGEDTYILKFPPRLPGGR